MKGDSCKMNVPFMNLIKKNGLTWQIPSRSPCVSNNKDYANFHNIWLTQSSAGINGKAPIKCCLPSDSVCDSFN